MAAPQQQKVAWMSGKAGRANNPALRQQAPEVEVECCREADSAPSVDDPRSRLLCQGHCLVKLLVLDVSAVLPAQIQARRLHACRAESFRPWLNFAVMIPAQPRH